MAQRQLSAQEIADKAFAAHPHIDEVYVTEADGHFHLHPHAKGSKKVLRAKEQKEERKQK